MNIKFNEECFALILGKVDESISIKVDYGC